ncbi:unnamed protein product, partial [Closterium sp. NIES-54]
SGVAIFDLDYDAILADMYSSSVTSENDCFLCVPPGPGIEVAALGASESALPGTAPAEALHTFTLESGASHCFFRDSTTLTPLSAPIPFRLADPSGGPVLARSSTFLPCPAVPSGSLAGLHLPLSSTNLVSTAALQDAMVTTTAPGGQRVSICTCTRTSRHLAMFTRLPGSCLYTLNIEPPQVAASAQVCTSGPVAPPCSCRLLSHQTLLWHHRLGHPSLPRLRGMHSHVLVFGLPRSLPPLPPSPAPPFLPCFEGRQRADPHSSLFPPTSAPPQTLHMDVKGDSPDFLIPWIRAVRLQLRERFRQDLPVLCLHSDRGGEFSSDLLWDFCRGEGILQSFTLPASPQQNEIAEHLIGLVMEVWGSRAFVRDMSADKLSACAIPCVFLGSPPNALGWQFYHPTSRRVLPSLDVTLDKLVPFYCLFPNRSTPLPPPPLFLALGPPLVDPLPPQGPAPSGVSQVDPLPGTVPVEVAVSGGAEHGGAEPVGAEPGVAESEGAGSGGAEPGGAEPGDAKPERAEPGGVEPKGVEPGGAESEGAESRGGARGGSFCPGGPLGALLRREPLSPPQLREWFARRTRLRSGAAGAGGAAGVGAGGIGAGAAGAGAARAGGGARVGVGDTGAGGAGPGGAGAGAVGAGSGDTGRPRSYFVPLLQHVLGLPSSIGLTPPLQCPPPDQSQPPLLQPPHCLLLLLTLSRPEGVDFFQSFSSTPKMTTLWVLLHVAARRDYELHSLDFSTAFLQGSLHEEIWLRHPPGFTGSFLAVTQWSLRRSVYGLRQAPRDWHDTLRTSLAALGFVPSTADPLLFLRTDTLLPSFYILVYVDDLVFATADTEALALVKSELQKRHTCTNLGELHSYLGLQITRDRARCTITLSQSHMVHQVLQRFGFRYSSPQSTPLPTGHSLSAPPSDESVELSGPYPDLVGCLMYLMTCTPPDLAYPLSILARYVASRRHRSEHWEAAKRVLRYLCSTLGMGLGLGGRVQLSLLVTQTLLGSNCEAEIYAGAMAAQELGRLTYLLTDLGEEPYSSPVLYVDNKAMIALCQEHRLEHITKHIALRYFLA